MSEPTRFYLPAYYAAERELAFYIQQLAKTSVQKIEPVTDGLEDKQPLAVEMACNSPVTVLYGKPGTGKTTTLRRIVQSFDKAGMMGCVLTPTGKAAKRADEVIHSEGIAYNSGRIECKTVHRGLEYDPRTGGFKRDYENQLACDYVIVEEASMLACMEARDTFSAINPETTRVIICGDPYQLPSVGAGNFLYDCIRSNSLAKTELIKIFRQGANSGIVHNASRILNGEMPVKVDPITGAEFKDFYFVPRATEEETKKTILEYIHEKIPHHFPDLDKIRDIQCLCPGKKSTIGTKNLNDALRELMNPGKEAYRGFRKNDKVINKRNNYDLMIVNGDVGKVIEVGTMGMVVDFGKGAGADESGIVKIEGDHADNIYLAYAYTVHGSQGSEFPIQISPVHMCHSTLLFRNLFYTAWTRGKQLSVTIGDPQALQTAVRRSVTEHRVTGLQELLSGMNLTAA